MWRRLSYVASEWIGCMSERAGLTRASVDLDARVSTEFCTGKCCVGELFNVGYFMIDGTISQCLNGRKGNVD